MNSFLARLCLIAACTPFALLGAAAPPQATVKFQVEFTADPAFVGSTEWVVEAKGSGAALSTWREVAKTSGVGPVVFTDVATAGQPYTVRMRARNKADPSVVSEPSNEASVNIPTGPPAPGGVQIKVILTVTVAPSTNP